MSKFMAASAESVADARKIKKAEKALAVLNAAAPPKDPALSPPLDWKRHKTLAEKCAILVALYSLVCTGEEKLIEPPPWPESFTRLWPAGDHAQLTFEDGIAWHALVTNVERLAPDDRHHIESWLKDLDEALKGRICHKWMASMARSGWRFFVEVAIEWAKKKLFVA